MHPHRDMEILTWNIDGSLEHRDSMGTGAVIRPGELQHMSAGTGVMHSEVNPSKDKPVHLLQIWLLPERKGLKPEYEQLAFPDKDLRGKFHQDANLYIARLDKGQEAKHQLKKDRHAWLQVTKGLIRVNGKELKQGDGAAISKETEVRVEAPESSEVLLFDLA